MFAALDVAYAASFANAGGVVFRDIERDLCIEEISIRCGSVDTYKAGEFYKRELPCLEKAYAALERRIDIIFIDAFVYLGESRRPGLGYYLYERINRRSAVIGVAKTAFVGTPSSLDVYRGSSSKPLYVSAIGVSLSLAKDLVRSMHGSHRIPTLLRRADQIARLGICDY